jgi:hypothetical protein
MAAPSSARPKRSRSDQVILLVHFGYPFMMTTRKYIKKAAMGAKCCRRSQRRTFGHACRRVQGRVAGPCVTNTPLTTVSSRAPVGDHIPSAKLPSLKFPESVESARIDGCVVTISGRAVAAASFVGNWLFASFFWEQAATENAAINNRILCMVSPLLKKIMTHVREKARSFSCPIHESVVPQAFRGAYLKASNYGCCKQHGHLVLMPM